MMPGHWFSVLQRTTARHPLRMGVPHEYYRYDSTQVEHPRCSGTTPTVLYLAPMEYWHWALYYSAQGPVLLGHTGGVVQRVWPPAGPFGPTSRCPMHMACNTAYMPVPSSARYPYWLGAIGTVQRSCTVPMALRSTLPMGH